jgi:Tol biopolymer transport system component
MRPKTLAWSRTGARLYFVVYGAQGHEIRVADLAGREEPSLLVAAPAGARIRDLRMSPSGNAFAYLVRNSDGVEEVYVWDLAAVRPLRVASGKTPRGALSLPGWSSDTAIVLIHSSQRGGSYHLDVSELGLDGRRRTVGQVQDGVIPNAKVDHQRGRLFLSRSTEGAQNLFTMSLADGSMRQVTANESPGISFAGVQPMGDDSILFARDERKRDVWLVQRGPRKP